MKTKIESFGIDLPKKRMTTAELLAQAKKKPKWNMEKITGIRERRVTTTESAFDLALGAARRAFGISKHRSADIDLIINAGVSKYNPDETYSFEPCQAALLAKALGAKKAITFDIVNACAGVFNAMLVVNNMLRAGTVKNALIVSGESNSYGYKAALQEIKSGFDGQFAALTLGDAGIAVILDRSEDDSIGIHRIDLSTGAKYCDLCVAKLSNKQPGGTMVTRPVQLHEVAMKNSPTLFKESLDKTGWTLEDMDIYIPHQTSRNALRKFRKLTEAYYKVPLADNFVNNLEKYGNTSSTSHFLALHECILDGRVKTGCRVQFGVGASGFSMGLATCTLDDMPERYRAAMQGVEL